MAAANKGIGAQILRFLRAIVDSLAILTAEAARSLLLLALDPGIGDWTTLRVPYPLGFYFRGMDGRIDDPEAGWKGRALWANYGTHFVGHIEGGKGTRARW